METIYLLVRNIIFIILIAVFIEMLLPMKETRRFLEVVVGLFVLITILNPIVSLIQQEPQLQLDIQEGNKQELDEILNQGKQLQQVQVEQARSNYGKRIEEQVAVIAQMVPGVEQAEARVQFAAGSSLDSVGVIEKVEIVIKKERSQSIVDPVKRVSIEPGDGEQAEEVEESDEGLLKQVQSTVASLYGLQPSKVVVTME
ncbi:MAG TPA: stage III sporulation protein AF [Syntrophaceticus sp.]|jgi:stage III sporulation protein AF|nr:stage III sporulation protein AF [Syntrophaceticus schinkii]MDD4675921.1 stage III sporulation protein AF [Syntrophaceticus schinkii]HHY30377.1 stage III sporulation protein AF [Syntrophaceticus sp.]